MSGEDGIDIPQQGQVPEGGTHDTGTTVDAAKGLAVASPADVLRATAGEVKSHDEMDLDTARTVLQALVDTHEDTITEGTPLDRIGEYDTEQIRQAQRVVAESLMNEYGVEGRYGGDPHLQKTTRQGRLVAFLDDASLTMTLYNNDNYALRNQFALREPEGTTKAFTAFWDFRTGQPNGTQPDGTSLYDLEKKPTLAGFRQMVRGARWMSANMLDWQKPDTIMPEQLDARALPPSQPAISGGE